MEKMIIVDASGSMAEKGKKSTVKYLLNAVRHILGSEYDDIVYSVWLWNNSVTQYGGEIKFEGKSDENALRTFLGEHNNTLLLVISDGRFSDDTKKIFRDTNAFFLKVGFETDIGYLQKIFPKGNVFEAVDTAECARRFANY